jgi:nitroreductase
LTQFALQAIELGYGTCWIGAFDEAGVKRVLKIPERTKVVICMTLGVPEGKHVHRGRKPVEEFVYLDQFGSRFNFDDTER